MFSGKVATIYVSYNMSMKEQDWNRELKVATWGSQHSKLQKKFKSLQDCGGCCILEGHSQVPECKAQWVGSLLLEERFISFWSERCTLSSSCTKSLWALEGSRAVSPGRRLAPSRPLLHQVLVEWAVPKQTPWQIGLPDGSVQGWNQLFK